MENNNNNNNNQDNNNQDNKSIQDINSIDENNINNNNNNQEIVNEINKEINEQEEKTKRRLSFQSLDNALPKTANHNAYTFQAFDQKDVRQGAYPKLSIDLFGTSKEIPQIFHELKFQIGEKRANRPDSPSSFLSTLQSSTTTVQKNQAKSFVETLSIKDIFKQQSSNNSPSTTVNGNVINNNTKNSNTTTPTDNNAAIIQGADVVIPPTKKEIDSIKKDGIELKPMNQSRNGDQQQKTNDGDSGLNSKDKSKAKQKASEYDVNEHELTLEQLSDKFTTDINFNDPSQSGGLTSSLAAELLSRYGKNILNPPKEIPWYVQLAKCFTNFFMILLEVAGALCFLAYGLDTSIRVNLYLACVLYAIVIFTCLLTFSQERQTGNIMKSFKNLLPQSCRVIRDGAETKIKVEDVVIGDIVVVSAGDKVPGDIRVITCNSMKVDNSSLTGESEPQSCTVTCTDDNPLESHNLAFYGTLVMDGSARGVVIRTGTNTLIGKIADMASNTEQTETTLQIETKRFVHFITILGITMGLLFFIIGFCVGIKPIPNLINVLGLIVANVPEGLPSTITACLTVTARRLSKRNVYSKKLESIETLGSITLIASDKTGTLTQNRMTVSHMWYDNQIFRAIENGGTIDRTLFDLKTPTCSALVKVGACCNRADFDRLLEGNMERPLENRLILGDASESALVRLCHKIEDIEITRAKNQKVFEIPFNSTNKWQLSIHKLENDNSSSRVLYMKGAPEIIFEKCSKIMQNGKEVEIDDKIKHDFITAYEALGSMGERCLGFAQILLTNENTVPNDLYDAQILNFPMTGLTFVGLCSLLDPPRENVPFAVHQCKTAGIKVIMVTGDHPITAKAIAKKVGIISSPTAEDIARERNIPLSEVDENEVGAVVLHGAELRDFTEADWDRVLSKGEIVFARTSPQQKSQIVENAQRRKEVVAVTGDGVNDSPALKKADIGVAMGIVGSDVAKETADIILLDDNFASIVAGIEEGRIIFDNLKKSIAYTLSHAVPEIAPFLLNIVAGIPLAITSFLILCIDLGTEMAPAISLAYEEGEKDIMTRKPRVLGKDHLVTTNLLSYSYLQAGPIEAIISFLNFFLVMASEGFPPHILPNTNNYFVEGAEPLNGWNAEKQVSALRKAQTAYFMTLVMCQFFNLLTNKTRVVPLWKHKIFTNIYVNIGLIIEAGICCFVIYTPFIHTIIESEVFPGIFWAYPLPMVFCLFAWNEIRKRIAFDYDFKISSSLGF